MMIQPVTPAARVEQGRSLDVAAEVKEWLINEGFQPEYGARPMRRAIQKNIGDPLSEEILKGRFKDVKKIRLIMKENVPTFVEEEAMAGV